jgi:mono/diheme cytochrome c family protein
MKPAPRTGLRFLLLAATVVGLRGCYSEGPVSGNGTGTGTGRGNNQVTTANSRDAGVDHSVTDVPPPPPLPDGGKPPSSDATVNHALGACKAAQTMEPAPARSVAVSADAVTGSSTLFVSDLFQIFKTDCGACHVDDSQGTFHVAESSFSTDMTDQVLTRIFSNDPNTVMPATAGPANTRDPKTDKYLLLGAQLQNWYMQGKPKDLYVGASSSTGNYRMSPAVGEALTNLGNCVPTVELLGINATPMKDLDAFFAAATALPTTLDKTDLTTFDSEVLAQTGVVAYAPAYPLWSDNARKIRHIRVPRGKSIVFDKATQQFNIPDNTRFYKTFLKKVIQRDGSERYQKIETRLIVARQPTTVDANGDDVQAALFGTYMWDENETSATLIDDPRRDGTPWLDHMRTVITDEGKYDHVNAQFKNSDSGFGSDSLDVALKKVGAVRTYAIPGKDRCVQCHEGSPSRSFVLGFLPLQINRRPLDVGGIIEPPGPDDLNQLQRFIDYGLITGISKTSDLLPLEKSEGDRPPRNNYELVAQGYMLGNCAHCHNPRGFPSITNKDTLRDVLSFLPGPAPGQGIFQFPLELYSKRITRDLPRADGSAVQMPYITPSLVDYPGVADYNHTVQHAPTTVVQGLPAIDNSGNNQPYVPKYMVLAPWRSLIYRNTDTPFAYADDLALFPHMPMNVPGYDCRIRQIMGDWMVSIPSVRKQTKTDVQLVQSDSYATQFGRTHDNTTPFNLPDGTDFPPDTSEQPYEEVKRGDPRYDQAVTETNQRLDLYHQKGKGYYTPTFSDPPQALPYKTAGYTGNDFTRYVSCPDTSDIVDYTVKDTDSSHSVPGDVEILALGTKTYRRPVDYVVNDNPAHLWDEDGNLIPSSAQLVWPSEGVPDRPDWVITDTTDLPGAWTPRRSDWEDILGKHVYTNLVQTGYDLEDVTKNVIEVLHPKDPAQPGILLKDIDTFATKQFPYGLWLKKDACASKLATMPTLDSYKGADRLRWMDKPDPKTGMLPDPKSAVYQELPGAAIFNMVCINCHGPLADSRGRQADTLALMTGGNARVADFKDGLFGPASNPEADINAVFSPKVWDAGVGPAGAEDWAARYMAFMALGGTSKHIPKAILNLVATTSIFGTIRSIPGVDSANMLGPIQTLCAQLFGVGPFRDKVDDPQYANTPAGQDLENWVLDDAPNAPSDLENFAWTHTIYESHFNAALLDNVGDAELLAQMCSLNNPPPIRIFEVVKKGENINGIYVTFASASHWGSAPVGTDKGTIENGISSTNLMPWCITQTSVLPSNFTGMPLCPANLTPLYYKDLWRWSSRGAINAGLSVFEYLKWFLIQKNTPVPPYDHCENL